MRIKFRQRKPLTPLILATILGTVGGVYIWHPLVKQVREEQIAAGLKTKTVESSQTTSSDSSASTT